MATVAAVNSLGDYAYNPRGNLWANDDSTFGHKLLLKMGWSKGKGLGKKENGIKENINVKVKNNNSGVGWKDKSYLNLQSTDYDSLLQNLSVEHSQQPMASNKNNESGSLEQRSQTFRNRLHYQKFIRGKDISKYSEKDMKSIFILNKTSEEDEEQHALNNSPSMKKDLNSENKVNEMETYRSQLNMCDYFAMKMNEKQSGKISRLSNSDLDVQPTCPDFIKVEDENSISNNAVSSDKTRKRISTVTIDDVNSVEKRTEIPLEASHPIKKRKKSTKNSFSKDSVFNTDTTCEIQEMHDDKLLIFKKKKKKHSLNENECIFADSIKILNKNADCRESESNVEADLTQSIEIEILEPTQSDNIKFNNNNVAFDIEELRNYKPTSSKKRGGNHINENICIPLESVKLPTKSANYQKSESNFEVDLTQSAEIEILEPALSDGINSNNNNVIYDTIDLPSNKPTSSKKRKRNHVNENICIPSESLALPEKSTNYQKIKQENRSKVDSTKLESVGRFESVLLDNRSPVREQKRAKRKLKHMKKLKSCLKSKRGKYSLKNVSFNETVSFRIINSDEFNSDSEVDATNETECITLDATNEIECITHGATSEIECIALGATNNSECNCLDAKYINKKGHKDATTSAQEIEISEQIVESTSSTAVEDVPAEVESEVGCSLSNLPSTKSSAYNEWVDSQRQAFKMKIYKRMLKSIKKHEVLRTSNLLSIRGYGNWGY